jgi:hypothetical protein
MRWFACLAFVSLGLAGASGFPVQLSDWKEIVMSDHHVSSQPIPYTHAFRIGLSLEDGRATVTSIQRVAMRAPASASGQPADGQSGVWVELRGARGRVLYYRALRTPHPDSLEVFEDEKTGAIRRVLTARPQVMKLDLIVPDLSDASELTLYGPKDPSEPDKPSVPLLQSPMRELRLRATTPPQ